MAQFLNQEVDPKAKASAKSNTDSAGTQEARVAWDDTTDQGVAAVDRAEVRLDALTAPVSAGQSFLAGAQNSIIAAAVRKAAAPDFPADSSFNVKQIMPVDPKMKLYKPDSDEIEYLHGSKSSEEYQYRTEQMLEQRTRNAEMGENLVAGITGAVLGDSPFILAPMGAYSIAGRIGLAVRTGIRAGDVTTAVYASDQPGQSQAVAAVIAGVSGIDQLFDMARVARVAAQSDRVAQSVESTVQSARNSTEVTDVSRFDPDAPTKRTAPDTRVSAGAPGSPGVLDSAVNLDQYKRWMDTPLKAPIKVAKGEQAQVVIKSQQVVAHLKQSSHLNPSARALLEVIEPVVHGIDVHLTANPARRSVFGFAPGSDGGQVIMRASNAQVGKTWSTVGDALNALDKDTANITVHELVHAATAQALRRPENAEAAAGLKALVDEIAQDSTLPANLKYYVSNSDEALAGMANSSEWIEYLSKRPYSGGTSTLRKIGEYVLNALGFKPSGSSLDEMLGHFETLIRSEGVRKDVPVFRSNSLSYLGENLPAAPAKQADTMLSRAKETFKQSFALYDNIAAGSKDLADLLVSDGAAVGARKPSVADFKRNLTLEMDGAASVVEDAIINHLKQRYNVGMLDRFFHRSNFKQARAAVEDKLAKYLDSAYDAEIHGRAVPTPDAEISGLVQAYKDSKWASRWHDHATASGLVDPSSFPKSDYYFPRQYSYDKMRQGILSGRTLDDYRDLFRQALRDAAPDMDSDVVQRVAREMAEGIWNGPKPNGGAMWRSLVQGITDDELVQAMARSGIDEASIQKFMRGNMSPAGSKTPPVRNLRGRTRFNLSKEYTVNGQSMRIGDLMDTDVAKVMHGYTNRMSGRVGFAYAGVSDLRKLAEQVDAAKHLSKDPARWQQTVDDTIDYMLGGVVGAQMHEWFRAAGNLANATMLKNSALYQITDTALAMKEFGMARVLRSMTEQPWFKQGSVVFRDREMASRLDSVLRGNIQRDMRFRWLNTYADDNLDLTRSSNWFNVTQNFGQAARHVNGMSMVHRAQVNFNAGIVMDEIQQMLKGDAQALSRLERYGLDPVDAARMQAEHAANPGKMLSPELQMRLEIAGTRMMDYVVQQVRTGETSYFAQLNPVGRVIIGYQSFAMAATNKVLRRTLNDTGPLGLMHLMAYQFPLMLLVSQTKAAMDGKDATEDKRKWITDAVLGMSAIGGLSLLAPVFSGQTPRHSLAAMGYVTQSLGALQDVAEGKGDIQTISKILPLVQEFAPTRAVINNFGDDE